MGRAILAVIAGYLVMALVVGTMLLSIYYPLLQAYGQSNA